MCNDADLPSPSRNSRLPNFASQMRSRILQHGVEYRLQIAGELEMTLQHLGGRGLLLQRLGQIIVRGAAR